MLKPKTFISFKISGIPLYSNNLSKRINEYQDYIKNNNYYNYTDNELCIINIHGLYGYRTGILGYLFNYTSYKLSKNKNPTFLQKYINKNRTKKNIGANDFEIISYCFSILFRALPILNFGNWDLKDKIFFKNLKSTNKNVSLPSIFNLKSLYLLSPLYDSGSRIYCNRTAKMSGFEKWHSKNNTIFNRGITWSYFESDNKENGIMVLNIEIDEDECIENQILQIITFKNKFEQQIISSGVQKYETFISGDFKIELNLMNTIPEIKKIWNIFDSNYISIYNNTEYDSPSNTHFILYSKIENNISLYCKNEEENKKIVSKYTIIEDTLYSINFINNENVKNDDKDIKINMEDVKNDDKDIKINMENDKEIITVENKKVNNDTPQENDIKNTIFINMNSIRHNYFENTKPLSSDEEWTEI
jgi:hypothetical protein